MAGDATAIGQLRALLSERVARYLVKVGASIQEAEEITGELLSDLLADTDGRPPLLRGFTGQCALCTWVNRVALNRWFATFRTSTDGVGERTDIPLDSLMAEPALMSRPDDEPLIAVLRDAIEGAMRERAPEDFVLFRLLHSEGLHQTELARMFGYDRRTVARQSDRVAAEIRTSIMAHLRTRAAALQLDWEDVVDLCRAAATDVIAPG